MPRNALHNRHMHDHLVRSARACPQRAGLDQSTPPGLLPAQMMCVRCGRVTARRDPSGLPWCGGAELTADQRAAERARYQNGGK